MAKKKAVKTEPEIEIAPAREQDITQTLELNYMPYAMSVIISRAIPEIDGFKPSHRKLLYTMYKMGLLNGPRTKSANVVGQTMKLNPHGDMSIYETMVRLTKGNEALLHPFVDSKGSFGKQYSKMAFAASRYTEVKLAPICAELFGGIEKEAVDFVDNYDNTLKEPKLFPTSFPNILVSPNVGIAVGLASTICSFNLAEVCDTTIALLKDPDHDISTTLLAPDFSTGGRLIYNKTQLDSVYSTGRGSIKVRAKYTVEAKGNCIEIIEIPYTTNVEAIIDKIEELVKSGKIKEISDIRDETDLNGLKIAIDTKKGTDPDKLMAKLYKLTPLEDDLSCNFNVIIEGTPMLMGVRQILNEWHAYRTECIKRETYYDLTQKSKQLHLLRGLEKILLDIDKAIKIIRETENDSEVVPNLARGFDIDEEQAEYIADIKLRNLNKEYILNRTAQIEKLEKEIADLEEILSSQKKLDKLIIKQLEQVKSKYGQPRKTEIIYEDDIVDITPEKEEVYPVFAVCTREGYFKKISMQSIRGNDEQKLKDDDKVMFSSEIPSDSELLFFTSKAQVYKAHLSEFDNIKASQLGDYVPAKLEFESDERLIFFAVEKEYDDRILLCFANGKCVVIPMSVYKTKTNRRKLTGAFSDACECIGIFRLDKNSEKDIFLKTKLGRALAINSSLVPLKSTRSSIGVQVISLKKGDGVVFSDFAENMGASLLPRYKKNKIPSAGMIFNEIDITENQEKLF